MKRQISAFWLAVLALALFSSCQAKKDGEPTLRVAFVGDPQVLNDTHLGYARHSIYQELRERKDLDLVVVLGDLVDNNISLLAPTRATLDSLPCPWIATPGNHDKDTYLDEVAAAAGKRVHLRPRDLATWRKVIGYVDTSFVMGNVRFVSMDNIRIYNNSKYHGGFVESQKQWLDSIVRITPEEQLLVLCVHKPLSTCKGLDTVSRILAPHKNLMVFAGHTHTVLRHSWKYEPEEACEGAQPMELEETIVGCTCGTYWRGKKDRHGIPVAWLDSGDPRCYYVAEFSGGRCEKLDFKMVGDELRASVTRRDSLVLVNVYGGRQDARVLLRSAEGEAPWLVAQPLEQPSPEVADIIAYNAAQTEEFKRANIEEIIPLRGQNCPHLWAVPARELPDGPLCLRYDDGLMRFEDIVSQ